MLNLCVCIFCSCVHITSLGEIHLSTSNNIKYKYDDIANAVHCSYPSGVSLP